jgi:hypothetical protein
MSPGFSGIFLSVFAMDEDGIVNIGMTGRRGRGKSGK